MNLNKEDLVNKLNLLKIQVNQEYTEYWLDITKFENARNYKKMEEIEKQHQVFLFKIDKALDDIEEKILWINYII